MTKSCNTMKPLQAFSRDYIAELKEQYPDYHKQITGHVDRKFITIKEIRLNKQKNEKFK